MKNSEMVQCSILCFLHRYDFHFWETLVFQAFPRLSKNGCKEKRDRSDKIASNDKNNFRFSPLFCRKAALKIGRTVLFFPKWRRNVSNGQKKSRSQFPGAKSDFCRNSAAVRSESLDSVYLRSSQNSQPNSDASDVNSRKERGRVFRIARSDPPPAF